MRRIDDYLAMKQVAKPLVSRAGAIVYDDMCEFMRCGRCEPVTEIQARLARDAYRDFGKGSGHSARLNFGDCFAYALAKTTSEPLLFIGADFRHTDIMPAIA